MSPIASSWVELGADCPGRGGAIFFKKDHLLGTSLTLHFSLWLLFPASCIQSTLATVSPSSAQASSHRPFSIAKKCLSCLPPSLRAPPGAPARSWPPVKLCRGHFHCFDLSEGICLLEGNLKPFHHSVTDARSCFSRPVLCVPFCHHFPLLVCVCFFF
jgi:hypothetical protein